MILIGYYLHHVLTGLNLMQSGRHEGVIILLSCETNLMNDSLTNDTAQTIC